MSWFQLFARAAPLQAYTLAIRNHTRFNNGAYIDTEFIVLAVNLRVQQRDRRLCGCSSWYYRHVIRGYVWDKTNWGAALLTNTCIAREWRHLFMTDSSIACLASMKSPWRRLKTLKTKLKIYGHHIGKLANERQPFLHGRIFESYVLHCTVRSHGLIDLSSQMHACRPLCWRVARATRNRMSRDLADARWRQSCISRSISDCDERLRRRGGRKKMKQNKKDCLWISLVARRFELCFTVVLRSTPQAWISKANNRHLVNTGLVFFQENIEQC